MTTLQMPSKIVHAVVLSTVLLSIITTTTAVAALQTMEGAAPPPSTVDPIAAERIKHIVVLMLENRAFDHVFGWYPGVDGINGSEFNLVNSSDVNSTRVYTTPNATYINACDPNHGYPPTSFKIFGRSAYEKGNFTVPTMGGFVDFEDHYDGGPLSLNYCNVMESFTPDRLPIINTLASEYVLFDRFFAAMPGPTWPNRIFFMSGTSSGLTETFPWYHDKKGQLFPTKTIFDQITEVGGTWQVAYNDTPWELFMGALALHPENLHSLGQFFDDCANGTLPDFTYINPRSGINISEGLGSNDEHPDHDMAVGERYLKDIYEAIRASPQWNETLFVVTYDEHGGFYDHVTPPMNVPPPGDNETSYPDKGFLFNRLGIRIPTLLISPWVPKGLIQNAPPAAQKPAPNSEYDLTSIIASARKILARLNGTGPLTKRDAWSATFEHLVTQLPEMRTDCPMHLPAPPPPTLSLVDEATLPVNSLQAHIMEVHAGLVGEEQPPRHITKQGHVSEWLRSTFQRHHARTATWKASKHHARSWRTVVSHDDEAAASALSSSSTPPPPYSVIVQPVFNHSYRNMSWLVNFVPNETTALPMTISIGLADNETYCLDSGLGVNGSHVGVTVCYPSPNPVYNRDVSQQWIVEKDATIRPFHNTSLCLSNAYFQGDIRAFLRTCVVGDVRQHWAYHGAAPGNPFVGTIFFSDWTTALKVVSG